MRKIHILSFALLLFTLSCGAVRGAKQGQMNLESTSWKIEELNGKSIEAVGDNYTLIFKSGDALNGRGGCNLFMGSYTQGSKGEITISPLGMTRTACPDMQTEMAYIQALESATSYSVAEGELFLIHDDVIIAKFKQLTDN